MASKTENDFVKNLGNFSIALEALVKTLKAQAKKSDTSGISTMANSIDKKLEIIVKELKSVKEDTKAIKKDTTDIRKAVESIKSEKKSSIMDLGAKSSSRSIADSVKTMILIAGGVLAIGLAFKIVGKVDFLSVLALSAGMWVIACLFEKMAKIEAFSVKKVTMLSLSMVIMAGAIALSGFILNTMPQMTIMTMISVLFVTLSMTIAIWGISKALDHMHLREMPKYLVLPVILPLMALGIVAAGKILKDMPEIEWKQVIAAGMIALALIPAVILVSIMSKAKVNMEDILVGTVGIIALSIAISAASQILSLGNYEKYPSLEWSITVGLTVLAFGLAAVGIGLFATGPIFWMGLLGLVSLSAGIMAVSHILKAGDYSKFPPIEWSKSVGLSIVAFSIAVLTLATGGLISAISSLFGGGSSTEEMLVGVAKAMVSVAKILNTYDWTNSRTPTKEWAEGAGIAVSFFTISMMKLSAGNSVSAMMDGVAMLFGGSKNKKTLESVAKYMVNVAKILNTYDWATSKTPTKEWAEGAGLAVSLFTVSMMKLSAGNSVSAMMDGVAMLFGGSKNKKTLESVAVIMKKVATELSNYNWDGAKYPKKEWAEGVGGSVAGFAEAISALKPSLMDNIMTLITGKQQDNFETTMTMIASGMIAAATELNKGDWDKIGKNYPKKEWSEGVATAIGGFTKAFEVVSSAGGGFLGIGGTSNAELMQQFSIFMRIISSTMIQVAKDFNIAGTDIYTNYPKTEWSNAVSGSIQSFAEAYKAIDDFGDFGDIVEASQSLIYMGKSIWMFTMIMKGIDTKSFTKNGMINNMADSMAKLTASLPSDAVAKNLFQVGVSIMFMAKAMDNLNSGKINQLIKLTRGMQMMSLIDEQKLAQVLTVMETKKRELHSIMDMGGSGVIGGLLEGMVDGVGGFLKGTANAIGGMINPNGGEDVITKKTKTEDDKRLVKMEELIGYVKNIDVNIDKLVTIQTPQPPEFKPEEFNKKN